MLHKLSPKFFFICAFVFLNVQIAFAQSSNVPFNQDYYNLLDRYEIKKKSFSPSFHTSVKQYNRASIAKFAEFLLDSMPNQSWSKADQFNINYLLNDNWEWTERATESDAKKPFLKYFYRKKSDAIHVKEKNFDLHLSPVVHFAFGNDTDSEEPTYINTRGVEVRGVISEKLGFYSFFSETQARFPFYVHQRIDATNAIPNERFWKVISDVGSKSIEQFAPEDELDFTRARGYITFNPFKNINIQFGHDRNRIGNGFRSLILSDFAPEYLFLKFNTKVWKLNYTNIYAQLQTRAPMGVNDDIPKKYMAFHHLSLNILENLNVGISESVVFRREDTLGDNYFDLEYLNPIILYRSLELGLGDRDNVSFALDFKWNFLNSFQLYGQWMIDDFNFGEFRQGNGFSNNKWGTQLGGKYIDVAGISNLDLQLEWNVVRPYTYSHFGADRQNGAYHHYGQPLAHPLGSNFRELIGVVRYQPIPRLNLTGKAIATTIGEDPLDGSQNWGSNIFLDYNTNVRDFDNEVAQGIEASILFLDFTASFQLRHNFFIDFKQVLRDYDSMDDTRDNSTAFTTIGVRWNFPQRFHEF